MHTEWNARKGRAVWFFLFGSLLLAGVILSLLIGSYPLSSGEIWLGLTGQSQRLDINTIVLHNRVPRTLTAALAGMGLALSGLLMQTLFRNELAGPTVLGISSGASLGVALAVLAGLGSGPWSQVMGATIGAFAVLVLIASVAGVFRDTGSLLVFGLMVAYLAGAMVSILQAGAEANRLKVFIQWGLGSFSPISGSEWKWIAGALVAGVLLVLPVFKWLDAMLLGANQAMSLGAPERRIRWLLLVGTGVVTGTITAFCGPVAFLGLAVPHLARGIWRTAEHSLILPGTLLLGAFLGLTCDVIVRAEPMGMSLPLNAVTSLMGAPVVIWVILRNAKLRSFL